MRVIRSIEPEVAAAIGDAPVLLVGSGVSIWSPTRLPTGVELSQAIARATLASRAATKGLFADPNFGSQFRELPFEVVMQQCPRLESARCELAEIFADAESNAAHKAIAISLAEGRLSHVVTTNYDRGIEAALPSGAAVAQVVRAEDSTSGHVCFKIHGDAGKSGGNGMVVALSDERALPQWKWELLSRVVDGNTLVLVGYSGRDFEICPALERMHPRAVWWNTLSAVGLPVGCRRVLERHHGTLVLCDMRELLQGVLGPIDPLVREAGRAGCRDWPRLDAVALSIWGVGILNRLGYPAVAMELALEIEPSVVGTDVEAQYWAHRADAAHQGAQYREAARMYETAAGLVQSTDTSRYRRFLLSASDNLRCCGRVLHGYRALKRANADADRDAAVVAVAGTKALLFLRHGYQLARVLPWLQRRLRRRAQTLIEQVRRDLLQSGEYFDFQQLALWAQRFGLDLSLTAPPDLYAALPVEEGYRQLGYTMAEMMAFRDSVLLGKREWSSAAEDEALRLVALATSRGILAEAWKLHYLLARKSSAARGKHFMAALGLFLRCQYNIPMRLWQLVAMN